MSILWPQTPGKGHIICDSQFACRNLNFPIPDPSIPYTVSCDENFECANSDIYCPSDAECTIDCTDLHSCQYTNIYCQSDQDCLYLDNRWIEIKIERPIEMDRDGDR